MSPLLLLSLFGVLAASTASATASVVSPMGVERLTADRSNLNSGRMSEQFAIGDDGKPPTFRWIPVHTKNDQHQSAFQIRVFQSHQQRGIGPNQPIWDSGRVASSLPRAEYGGDSLRGRTYYTWICRWWDANNVASEWSAPAEFHFAPTHEQTSNATWIASANESVNLMRTEFTVPKGSSRVTLYVLGLGYSYATVNGVAASQQLLHTAPWSNNERRSAYSTIDITKLCTEDTNVLGVALGNGYRDLSAFKRNDPDDNGFDAHMITLWAQIVVSTNADDVIVADTANPTWYGAAGPVTYSSVYNGETYDASLEQTNWDHPSFDVSSWEKVPVNMDPPRGKIAPWMGPTVTLDKIVKPVNVTQPHPGIFVVDFGVNQAGVCKLSNIKLPKGANVTLQHGEILQHEYLPDLNGKIDPTMPYYGNLRSAKATDVYIAKGDPNGETFYPQFTYHGFRYVQVTGLSSLSADDIEMHHFHGAVDQMSTPSFKSPILTKLYEMAVGSQRSNMMTLQTDCDQRDERLGWMGDANLSGDSLVLNFKYGAFLMSYLKIMIDELNTDFSGTDTSPLVRYGSRPGDISWTTAVIAFPYAAYKAYGDLEPARTYFNDLVGHVGNILSQCKGEAGTTCPTRYGDWVPPNPPGQGQGPKPSAPFTSAFSLVDAVMKVHELAVALGNTTAANQLSAMYAKLAPSFNSAFFQQNSSSYDNGLMTTYTLPLHLGIVPNASLTSVQKNLLDEVSTKFKDHNQCGIIGMKFLFEQLAAMGRKDIALAVLETTSYPSLGFMAYNTYEPATANVWELWDAYHEGTGMNSRNHHMFSSYSKYMIEDIAGLVHSHSDSGSKINLNAATDYGLSGASITAELEQGNVSFAWERAGGLQCAKAPAGERAEISCGVDGGVVESVRFASWGLPFGTCGSFGFTSSCHTDVTAEVLKRCLGKSNCSVSTEDLVSEDNDCTSIPAGHLKNLYAEVECSSAIKVHVTSDIPVAASGSLVIPLHGMSSPVLQSEKEYSSEISTSSRGERQITIPLGSGHSKMSLVATKPNVVVDGSIVGSHLTLSCPVNHVTSRVRFASFGNPTQKMSAGGMSETPVRVRGDCHIASTIMDTETSCLGKGTCTIRIDTSRLENVSCLNDQSVLAVQLECATM